MVTRPGTHLARRPLHFILVADCSGSMAADGKIQALNNAIREMLPHLGQVARENPHVELLFSALAFSTGVRWHMESPTPADDVVWHDLLAGGYTDLGAALTVVAERISVGTIGQRAMAPAIVLVSDGQPTDDFDLGLRTLLASPSVRAPHVTRWRSGATPIGTCSPGSRAAASRCSPTTPSSWSARSGGRPPRSPGLRPSCSRPIRWRARSPGNHPIRAKGTTCGEPTPRPWTLLSASATGSSHRTSGAPNQDAVASFETDVGLCVALADGHGGARYVRSGTGSQLAVQVAVRLGERLPPPTAPAPRERARAGGTARARVGAGGARRPARLGPTRRTSSASSVPTR